MIARPTYRELDKKLKNARKALKKGNIFFIDQAVIASDAAELGYLVENILDVLSQVLDEITPDHYIGHHPPIRSYEEKIKNQELFIFRADCDCLGCEIYLKFALIDNLNGLWEFRETKLRKRLKNVTEFIEEEFGGRTRLAYTDADRAEQLLDEELTPRGKEILEKHKFSIGELDNWRLTFLGFGTFGLRLKVMSLKKPYLKEISEATLVKTEDPYRIVHRLNWLIHICGGKSTTVKELLLGFSKYKYCPYCSSPYRPTRRDQTNCGSAACKRANRLKRQKEWRKRKKLSSNKS